MTRLVDGPIISPDTHPSIGKNINGPCLVRVPDWLAEPLGTYYLYFADHKGEHIHLAFADELKGPWTVHPGGVLTLSESRFLVSEPQATEEELAVIERLYEEAMGEGVPPLGVRPDITTPHIASPDVRVNDWYRTFTMYFHGLESLGVQATRHATSVDGLSFEVDPLVIEGTYLRAFRHDETEYALAMPGRIHRRVGSPTELESGPDLLPQSARHAGVLVVDDELQVFWSRVGDSPERILLSTVDLSGPWREWSASDPVEVIRPEHDWEGADEPLVPSRRSAAPGAVNQLRDPFAFSDDGCTYLVYALAGESGLGLARLDI